jgi:tetratricopeptide (TPR) repeat protein
LFLVGYHLPAPFERPEPRMPSFLSRTVLILALLSATLVSRHAIAAAVPQDAEKEKRETFDASSLKQIAGDPAKWSTLRDGRAHVLCWFEAGDAESAFTIGFISAFVRALPASNVEFAIISPESEQTMRAMMNRLAVRNIAVLLDKEKKIAPLFNRASGAEGRKFTLAIANGNEVVWRGDARSSDFVLILTLASAGRFDPKLLAQAKPMYDSLKESLRLKNYRDAFRTYDNIIALDSKVFGGIAVEKYLVMIRDAKNPAAARAWGEEMLTKYASDPHTLSQLADEIVTNDEIKQRDYELANRAIDAMSKLVAPHDASALSLRASVLAAQGRYEEAIELQYEAWMASGEFFKAERRKVLDEYRGLAKKAAAKAKAASPGGDASPASEGGASPAEEKTAPAVGTGAPKPE